MGREIERKFLVSSSGWRKRASRGTQLRQSYLAVTDKVSVRVRTIGNSKAYLTIKSAEPRLSRLEFEYAIPVEDARALMKLRTGRLITKRRYIVKVNKLRFEVDVFHGDHRGLTIAELESHRARFEPPDWLGKEVTGEGKYYNARLARAKRRR